jgi:hypothetical protein
MMLTVTAEPESICKGDFSQLNADAIGGLGVYTYTWSSNPFGYSSTSQNPVVSPMSSTTYNVGVTDGDQTAYGSVLVTVNEIPEVILGEWPEQLCNVGTPPVQLTAEPEGGTYDGSGVTITGVFTPETADIGWNVITYTYEDAIGCGDSAQDSIYVDDCVGINEIDANEISVNLYPNPSAGAFNIEAEKEIERIEIIDQSGKMVMMRKVDGNSTMISALRSNGLYFVRIYIENENALPSVVTKEFIIR